MENNYFTTSDMGLSAYLKSKSIPFKGVQLQDPNNKRNICEFTFAIDKADPRIKEILQEWNHSEKCFEIKRILYMYRTMKKHIMDFLSEERPKRQNPAKEHKPYNPKAVDDAINKMINE